MVIKYLWRRQTVCFRCIAYQLSTATAYRARLSFKFFHVLKFDFYDFYYLPSMKFIKTIHITYSSTTNYIS